MRIALAISLTLVVLAASASFAGDTILAVKRPAPAPANTLYPGNRAPLAPSPLLKLPVGAVKPQGWLRRQMELMADGFSGHLDELSGFLAPEGNAWLRPDGEGDRSFWEELPYWLKGFGDLGYLLDDPRITKEARRWLEVAIASQREDGYFGPRRNLDRSPDVKAGKPDLWPNMVMLNALQSYCEYSGDQRVPKLMAKYFRWELGIPEADFLLPFWQQQRAADNLSSVFWLYNRTGEPWLLELGEKIQRRTANWTEGVASWHGVNISQSFRGPAVYFQQSKDPKFLTATERNYNTVRDAYGQVPGGLYGADENCRPGYTDPRQAAETCTMAEMMLSHEMLLAISGDPKWADRCEDVAFNSLPASMTADYKALRYLTAPNMILSDRHNKSPGLQNGGAMLLYDPRSHRCCQHNVAHGWPYFTEHLWMATAGNGLAAAMYAPCVVKAKVGDGTEVKITEQTEYPFRGTVELILTTRNSVRFPLYLRVPGWCEGAKVQVNGKELATRAKPASFLLIERTWSDGDKVRLELPMKVRLTRWPKNKNSVSVNRGPLTYSLKIGEKIVRVGGTDKWPAVEIHPTTPWNYGLVIPEEGIESLLQEGIESFLLPIMEDRGPIPDQPFILETRLKILAIAKRIPGWKQDHLGLVGLLQQSPVKSNEPIETVALIPMGCARLRIASFPVIGEGPDAREWPVEATFERHAASHCWENDTVDALSDGQEWKPVGTAGPYGVAPDKFNAVRFAPVTTRQLRLAADLQAEFSAGILEWRVK